AVPWGRGACSGTLMGVKLAGGDWGRQTSVGAFGLGWVLLSGASGAYHAVVADEPVLRYFRLVDYSAIFVLIAGTYTPVIVLMLTGRRRAVMLGLMWGLAALGIAARWLLEAPPYPVTVGLYVALGWIGLPPLFRLVRAVGTRALGWCLLRGVRSTLGGLCDALDWPVLLPHWFGPHETLHVLDMGATLAHVQFIVRYILPYRPAAALAGALAVG